MAQPASLEMIASNISQFNGNYRKLSETLKQTSERLDTGSASVALQQLGDVISASQDLSVGELKKTRKDLSILKEQVNQSNRISEGDRENILSLISNQEKIVSQNTTLAKRAADFVQTKVKENSIDITGVVSGALAESPALAMGVTFIGNKIKEMREAAKERKAQRAERIAALQEQERIQDQEYEALRGVITNQQTLEKMNMSQEEATQNAIAAGKDYQEYVDELKNTLITESRSRAQREQLEKDRIEALDSLREKYAISVGGETTDSNDSPVSTPNKSPSVSGGGDGFERIEDGLHEGTPYLAQIRDLLSFMGDETTGDIETQRESKRLELKKLTEAERTNELLEKLLKVGGVGGGAGNEGSLLDTAGDIGGALALGSAALTQVKGLFGKVKSFFGFGGAPEGKAKVKSTAKPIKPRGRFGNLFRLGTKITATAGGFLGLNKLFGGADDAVAPKPAASKGFLRNTFDKLRGVNNTPEVVTRTAPTVGRDATTGRFTKLPAAPPPPKPSIIAKSFNSVKNIIPKGMFGRSLGLLSVGFGAYDVAQILKDEDLSKNEKTEEVSAVVGGTGGAMAGAAAGAIAGSVVPVVGTLLGTLIGGAAGYFLGDKVGREASNIFKAPESVELNEEGKIITKKIEPMIGENLPEKVEPRPERVGRMMPGQAAELKRKQSEWDALYGLSYDKDGNLLSQERQSINIKSDEIQKQLMLTDRQKAALLASQQRNSAMKENALNSALPSAVDGAKTAIVNAPTSVTNNSSSTAIVMPSVRNNEMALLQSHNLLKGGW